MSSNVVRCRLKLFQTKLKCTSDINYPGLGSPPFSTFTQISQLIFLFQVGLTGKQSRKSWEDCPSLSASDYGASSLSCKKTTCSLVCPAGQSTSGKSKYKCKKGNWKGSLGSCQSSGGTNGGNGSTNGGGEFGNCSRPPIPSDLKISCSSGGLQISIFCVFCNFLMFRFPNMFSWL